MPARNEEPCLPGVLSAVPPAIDKVIVVDNGATTRTAQSPGKNGARVIHFPCRATGSDMLAGFASSRTNPPVVVAFADADWKAIGLKTSLALLVPLIHGERLAMAIRVPDSRRRPEPPAALRNRLAHRPHQPYLGTWRNGFWVPCAP